MSQCFFIHDFYQDGRLDVLAEVRLLQAYGQWTKKKRADWTKSAKVCFERTRHTEYSQTGSYYAGRLAGLQSAITAHYPAPRQQTYGSMVMTSLPDRKMIFCGSCGDYALWCCTEVGKPDPIRYRCDRCKQELVRELTAYIMPDGWDWDDHEEELPPLPQFYSGKIKLAEIGKSATEIGKTVLPFTAIMSMSLLNTLDPTAHITFLQVLIVYGLVRFISANIVRALIFLDEKAKGIQNEHHQ